MSVVDEYTSLKSVMVLGNTDRVSLRYIAVLDSGGIACGATIHLDDGDVIDRLMSVDTVGGNNWIDDADVTLTNELRFNRWCIVGNPNSNEVAVYRDSDGIRLYTITRDNIGNGAAYGDTIAIDDNYLYVCAPEYANTDISDVTRGRVLCYSLLDLYAFIHKELCSKSGDNVTNVDDK